MYLPYEQSQLLFLSGLSARILVPSLGIYGRVAKLSRAAINVHKVNAISLYGGLNHLLL